MTFLITNTREFIESSMAHYNHQTFNIWKNYPILNESFLNSQIDSFSNWLWARMDSNHRTPKRTDLQSVAVGHLATCPIWRFASHYDGRTETLRPSKSHLSESNQRPTDYKSVALPAELKWRVLDPPFCSIVRTVKPIKELPNFLGRQR